MAVKPIVKTFEYFLDRLLRGFKKDQGREPNNLEMILIKQEAGNKAKDANKVIEVQFGKPFGEEVNKLIESGDVKIGEVTKKNDNVLTREMFQNSNLNKPTIEGQMEKITNASNRIDEIMKEQANMYRPKTDEEIAAKFERQNKEAAERLRKKMKDEPEDKADGGRMGFAGGKIVLGKKILDLLKNNKKIQEAVDNIFGTGDYKMDAEMAAESLVELNPKTFGNKLYEDLDDATRMEIYGAVLRPITTNMAKMRELKKASKPTKTLESIKETGTIDISDPNVADEFARFMKETDPEGSKKLEQTVELANFDPKKVKGNAEGGRIGYYTGGITDVEPSLDDIGHGSDSLMSRTRLMSPGAQATTSTGLNYLLAEDNDNLRIPFSGGGDPKRRAFLKLLATLTGGIAGIKSGFIGLGEGGAKKAVTETVKQSAGNYPPPYFFKLVEKIKFMGDDITEKAATKDREIVKRYKDFEMTEDVATGDIVIKKRNEGSFYDQDGIISDEYIVYKPGQADEMTKGKKPPAEYEEYTVRPDAEGKLRDSEDGLDSIDEILEEVGDPDSMTLKKADGGRIGYNIGGLSKLGITGSSRRFLEKVFGKEKFKNMIENDPELHRGMLEVVEMFRSKDKSGLVEYMQNFLPQMSKKEIEDFVVGSGDISGIEGQLIRLGSGRDYKGKLDMMKEADNVRKLENFDIDGVSKNAEGGRIGFSGGGIFRAIIAKSAARAGMKPYEYIKATSYKSLPPEVKMFMSKADFEKLKMGQEQMYSNYIDMAKTRKNFQEQVEGGKNTPARELFEGMEKTMDEQSFVPKTVTSDDIAEMELMVKNRFNKGRKDNADGGIQTMLGE